MLREAGARGTRMQQRGKWKTFPGAFEAPGGLPLPGSFVSDSQQFARLPKNVRAPARLDRPYWITSSALASRADGRSRFSVRAVVTLIASLNLVEFTIGRSAGRSPLRIRPP